MFAMGPVTNHDGTKRIAAKIGFPHGRQVLRVAKSRFSTKNTNFPGVAKIDPCKNCDPWGARNSRELLVVKSPLLNYSRKTTDLGTPSTPFSVGVSAKAVLYFRKGVFLVWLGA